MATADTSVLARTAAEPEWNSIYKAGGVCLVVSGGIFFISAILSMMIGPAPNDGETYLRAVTSHATLSFLNFALFTLTDFLLLPAVFALYLALHHINKGGMLAAGAFLALYICLDLSSTELNSLTLLTLGRHYNTAGETLRAAYVTAANYALATLPISTFYSYFVSSVGLLIASLIMLKGVFSKPTALAGIVASVEGIVGSFYIFVPTLAILPVPSLIAFGVWSVLTGWRLYRIATPST